MKKLQFIRAVFYKRCVEVKFTMVSDCCHSGGMLDHHEIVISGATQTNLKSEKKTKERGISVEEVLEDMSNVKDSTKKKNRAIDLETMASMLDEVTKKKESAEKKEIVDHNKIR